MTGNLWIRQIALVTRELESAVESLRERLAIDISHRDPAIAYFGLHNAVMPIGTTFLEVVAPTKEGTTAGRLLERRGGDGGYMILLQTDSLERDRARFAELGVREVFEVTEDDIREVHLHPKDVGGAIVAFTEATPMESWRWAGPGWEEQVRAEVVTGLCAAELQDSDPAALAERWSRVVDRPVRALTSDSFEIALDRGTSLRFVPASDGRGGGLGGFDVKGASGVDASAFELVGTRIRVV
jgi:hypothetical protein